MNPSGPKPEKHVSIIMPGDNDFLDNITQHPTLHNFERKSEVDMDRTQLKSLEEDGALNSQTQINMTYESKQAPSTAK